MKLSTGKVAFPIEFDNGDKAVIYFNPNDPDLMIRIKGLSESIEQKIENLDNIELDEDGKPKYASDIEKFEKLQNIFKEELDRAFGGSISAAVFKYCSPFAIINGEYFVEQFIQAIIPEIEKSIKKESAEAQNRMSKYLAKYGK